MWAVEPKKMVRLLDLRPKDRLPVLAEGLQLLVRNVEEKHSGAACLFEAGKHTSASLLMGFAIEEAAKALMLLDAVRMHWRPDADVRRLLNRSFYDHHSRLMYAYVYQFPAHLDRVEIENLVDGERDSYVLDGPEGFDYVFRNAQLAEREGLMYVDFCVDTEGRGEWSDPTDWGSPSIFVPDEMRKSHVVELVGSLSHLGLFTTEGLRAIFKAWAKAERGVTWQEVIDLNWRSLEILDQTVGLAPSHTAQDEKLAVYGWHMPLIAIDLTENRKVTLSQVKARQKALADSYFAREYGDNSYDDFYEQYW